MSLDSEFAQHIGVAGDRLGALARWRKAVVVSVNRTAADALGGLPDGELERRLIEIGFVEGATVEVVHEGFLGRDPIAVRVNDHIVALRRREANAVYVAPGNAGA